MKARFPIGLVLLMLLVGPAPVRAEDWPQFRGPGGRGVSRETKLPVTWSSTEGIRWKADLPGRGLSSPVISKGRVYVTACSGYREQRLHVLCFEAATGRKLWERQWTATGNTNCHPMTCMAAPTPVTDGEQVYALFATGDLAALDRDGNQLWYRSLVGDYPSVTNQVGMAASPVLAGSTLLLPLENVGDSFAAGIDIRTGKNRWKISRPKEINWVTPLVVTSANRSVAVFHTSGEVLACDPASGKVRWSLASEGISTIPSPTESEGLIIIPGEPARALKPGKDGTEAEVVWTSSKLNGGHPSPVSYQGRIYGLARVALNCVNAKDGSDVWSLRLPGKFAASPVIAGGRAYIVTQEGLTLVVSLGEKPAIVARNALGDSMLATPAICDGCIYLRSDKALYCIGGSKGS